MKTEKVIEFHKKLIKFLKTELLKDDDLYFPKIIIEPDCIKYTTFEYDPDHTGECKITSEVSFDNWWRDMDNG